MVCDGEIVKPAAALIIGAAGPNERMAGKSSIANRIASAAVPKRRYMGRPRRPGLAVGMYSSAGAL